MLELRNKIVCGDCIKVLRDEKPFADLIFADPPFNIGYKYDKYKDNVKAKTYIDWSKEWMTACCDVLKAHGSFYIAIGDTHAADIKKIADQLGLTMRNWLIWHYSFGQQMKNKFARSHTHILYFAKNKKNFTFNDDAVRIISDRQKKYKDKRANPKGKMPDDVWNEYPRVCGTFKERVNFPCQMPESLLARIIRVSSNESDWILDPFSGSGTTLFVAHKLNRSYTGIDISKKYVLSSGKRFRNSNPDFPPSADRKRKVESQTEWTEQMDKELKWLYDENKVSENQLRENKMLLNLFTKKLNNRLGKIKNYSPEKILTRLEKLRKEGKLRPHSEQAVC